MLQLTAGHYEPGGIAALGMDHAIFIVEQGTLSIQDIPDDQQVSIAANIFVCDQGSFIVKDAFFRSAGNFFFNYFISSAETSNMFFQGAKFSFVSTELAANNPQATGAALWLIRGDSSVSVIPSTNPDHEYGE